MHLLVLSAFRLAHDGVRSDGLLVSMHLLVLSAFRLRPGSRLAAPGESVSMHLLVLSAFRPWARPLVGQSFQSLNAPFGAQCFPT